MVSLVRRWLPDRSIKLMGDSASSVLELGLHANAQQVTLVTTGRLDAVLQEPPPQRTRHTIGRPRVEGLRLPALEKVLQEPQTLWQKLTLDCYGEGERTLERKRACFELNDLPTWTSQRGEVIHDVVSLTCWKTRRPDTTHA
jgi:hypothetical protein